MPWLVGTALLHSLAASEKRGVFKSWTVLLAVMAFSLSLLGTFLVRSGVLTSVHSFAADPTRGLYILLFLLIVVGGSLLLFAFRAHRLTSTQGYELVSRESGLLLNNLLLVVACAAVLIGTMYPLVIDALGLGKLSVGEQWFNVVFVPLMLPILLAVGVGALLNWKRDKLKGKLNSLIVLAVVSVIGGALLAASFSDYKITAAASIALTLWITLTTVYGVYYRLRNKKLRLSSITHTPAAFWGMSIAHAGLAMFTLGVALTSIYTKEETVRMSAGSEHQVGDYNFRFNSVEEVRGPNYSAAQANLSFTDLHGGQTGTVIAEKRVYDVRRENMTEAGIDGDMSRDLFVALGEHLGNGAWSVRLQVKPYIRWIWLGTVFMGLGGILAASDRRYRKLAVVRDKKTAAASAAAIPATSQ